MQVKYINKVRFVCICAITSCMLIQGQTNNNVEHDSEVLKLMQSVVDTVDVSEKIYEIISVSSYHSITPTRTSKAPSSEEINFTERAKLIAIKSLLSQGATPNWRDPKSGFTVLDHSILQEYKKITWCLLGNRYESLLNISSLESALLLAEKKENEFLSIRIKELIADRKKAQ